MGGVFTKLVERNTTIPTHKSQVFSTAEDNQPAVDVYVFQGERQMARDNKLLGNFKLDGIRPAPRGLAVIEVSFDIDANGILNVAAKEEATGKEQKITISASTNLTKEDIQRLVKESTLNAAADRTAREEADLRNDADQACYQIGRQLKDGGDKVRETNRSRAELLMADLKEKLGRQESMDEIKKCVADLRSLLSMVQEDIAASSDGQSSGDSSQPQAGSAHHSGNGKNGAHQSAPGSADDVIDVEATAV